MSLWRHLSFPQATVHISNSIKYANFILDTNIKQNDVHLMIKVTVTLTDDEGHRWRSKVTKWANGNILQTIALSLYLIPSYNTISDI